MERKLQALKVPELKKVLQDHNLPTTGNKAELIQRIIADPAAAQSAGAGEEEDGNAAEATEADDGEDLLA